MGYSTRYSLTGNMDLVFIFEEEYENAGYALKTNDPCKWYTHENDLREFSILHPNDIFTLEGIGEEEGDIWRKYFLNGKVQKENAVITFGEFDKEKLK